MNKTVLVTGANHGLGLSLVKVFLDAGYTVFAGVYKLNDATQINCLKDKANLHLVSMDIADLESVKEAARFVRSHTLLLDVLINNAGVISHDEAVDSQKTILDELDFDSIKEVIDINAIGSLRVANIFSQLLMNGSDKLLVNISSEAGSITDCERDKWFGYCMSKAALNMAGTIIHNELKKHGGQVLQIHPGYIQTYMHGKKNEKATYSADFSAENIYKQIQNPEHRNSEKSVFIDLFGNKMDW